MRKRRFAEPLLYALAGVQAAQLAFLCYATWVVAAALVPGCRAERGLHALVNASWALLAAVWCASPFFVRSCNVSAAKILAGYATHLLPFALTTLFVLRGYPPACS